MVDSTKQNVKHTPGPWRIGEYDKILDAKGLIVQVCGTASPCGYVPPDHIGYANARLIAAAPEMLEALELAQRWLLNCLPVTELDGPKPLPVIAKAIRKAVADGR